MLNRLSFLAAALLTVALTASPALATTAPVGVWKLDEGSGTHVADASGNDNDGVLSGGVSWVAGVSGSALSFDGGTGQVKVSDNTMLEPATTVTISAWVKHAGSPGDYSYVAAKGANGCIAASYGLYSGPGGGLQFYVSQQRGSVYARSPDAGQRVWDGNWHLVVGTYDGSTIRLYVDGAQVSSGTPWKGALEYLLPDSNDFYIGNYPGCADHAFLGAVDNVMVWNRALSAADVAGLITPGAGNPPSQTPPPTGGGTQSGGTQGGSGTQGNGGSGGGGTSNKNTSSVPSVRDVKLSASTVSIDTHGRVISQGSAWPTLTYIESQSASLTMTLLRSERGVRSGRRCVAPSRHRHGRRCSRFVVISSTVHTDPAGRLSVRLSQLLHGRLSPGTYRLNVTPRANGKVGKTVTVQFVVRRARTHH
jgi:concanavalin A-like lectin/glucanase superfamily protein